MKNIKTFSIGILIIFMMISQTSFSQNYEKQSPEVQNQKMLLSNNSTRNLYHIKTWNYNKELNDDSTKMKVAMEKLEGEILMSKGFIYSSKINDDEYILVSSHESDIHIKIIQKIFYPYTIKINIIETKKIDNSLLDFSTIPIYSSQETVSFIQEMANWKIKHKETLEKLNSQFN